MFCLGIEYDKPVYIRYMIFKEDTEIKRLGDLFILKAGKALTVKDFEDYSLDIEVINELIRFTRQLRREYAVNGSIEA